MAAVERMFAAERAERRDEIESATMPLLVEKIASAGLTVVGFWLFLVLGRCLFSVKIICMCREWQTFIPDAKRVRGMTTPYPNP